ncbi:hypothetical protein [Actinoplanes sp. NPDC026623]|uniref:hypothetical protein n=1 Tax=Actinoplanes sp. NPDC026623 TaxID=3155610 RepID=UPI0033FE3C1E
MMLRVNKAFVVGLLCLPAMSGCTHGDKADTASPPTAAAPDGPSASAPPDTNPDPGSPLKLPSGAKVLLPIRSGKGSETLPKFDPSGQSYTVVVTCSGKGQIHLSPNNGSGDDSLCDGVPWAYRVFHPSGAQEVRLAAEDGAKWEAGVVQGTPPIQ